MNNYTIYCTKEQTKKALDLGAPIETYIHVEPEYSMANGCLPYPEEIEMLKKPTADQMIGWLEEHDIYFEIEHYSRNYSCTFTHGTEYIIDTYTGSRKKATLDAIDAVLEYLTNNMKEDIVNNKQYSIERKYSELRMPLDDDDKLASEVYYKHVKIIPPVGFLIGKITELDDGMLVEYKKK